MKRGTILVEAGKPLQFLEVVETNSPPSADREGVLRISDALKAYLGAGRDLLKGKYSCHADVAPVHLKSRCNAIVMGCNDGAFVRYDAAPGDDPGMIRAGKMSSSLRDIAPQLSEHVVHIGEPDPALMPLGPKITFNTTDIAGSTRELATLHPAFFANPELPEGFQLPKPPARPFCLLSLLSEMTVWVNAVVMDGAEQHPFVALWPLKLPVGWQAIEIYPPLGDEYWNPEYAANWAELDILAAAAQHNLQDKQLTDLDPRADTRRNYAALLAQCESLLQGPEEPIHQFLLQHPELISPTSDKVWSKVPFGATKSDFVFREAHEDYELVEIEAPSRRLFRQDGQQHGELTHAINQTTDWVRYIEDNKDTVERELGLTGISINPRRMVVLGRSSSLTEENRRKLTTLQNEQPKLRILTYDDLFARARANLERILGPLILIGPNLKLYFLPKTVRPA
jgi:hypothetical protein